VVTPSTQTHGLDAVVALTRVDLRSHLCIANISDVAQISKKISGEIDWLFLHYGGDQTVFCTTPIV